MAYEAHINRLRSSIRGRVILPADPSYDSVREIWNRLFDRRPALVVKCAEQADVCSAIRFATEHELDISVRGGGHHAAGYASIEGGMIIDLSDMCSIRVDLNQRKAIAQAGLKWGDFDHETQAHGLACTGPIVSLTGLSGFVLGGGFGWLHRKVGLACDNLVAADVITADGSLVRASLQDDSELLWGLRGAGWNFGVVTSLELSLQEIGPQVLAGLIYFPLEKLHPLAALHQEVIEESPRELTTWFVLRLAPPTNDIPEATRGRPVCALAFCHCGSREEAEKWARTVRGFGPSIADSVEWRPYVDWQKGLDARWGNGFYNEWRSRYFDSLDPACLSTLIDHLGRLESPWTDIKIAHLGGAIVSVPQGGSAFEGRQHRFALVIQARWQDVDESEKNLAWARGLHQELEPFASDGVYLNFLARDETSRIASAHSSSHYSRLQTLKGRLDPNNVFRNNPNIPPLPGRGNIILGYGQG